MADAELVKGYECTVTFATVALANIRNVKFPVSANEINTTTRFDQGWEATAQGLKKFGMTCDIQYIKTSHADWDIIAQYFESGASGTLLCSDSDGHTASVPVVVTQFDKDESETNVRMASVTFRKARGDVSYAGGTVW